MQSFWMMLLASLGSVAALLNNPVLSHNIQKANTSGNLEPATGGGDEHANVFFPATLLDDVSWEYLKCKGDNLLKAMHASDKEAAKLWSPLLTSAESEWEDFGDLTGWFWHDQTDPELMQVNFKKDEPGSPGFGIGLALKALGLPEEQSNNPKTSIQIIYVVHADPSRSNLNQNDPNFIDVDDQTYNAGRTYRATGGYYKFGIETSTGAIFGLDRLAPEKAAEERNPKIEKDGLPRLQRFSDVAWLFWVQRANTPPSKNNLKYFFSLAITNEQTQQAIRRALQNTNQPFGLWPGATFSTESDEGKVLLGSPNGRAYGYFLAQHKAQLAGNMYISQIKVFMGETEPTTPNMVLFVERARPAAEKPTKKRVLRRQRARL